MQPSTHARRWPKGESAGSSGTSIGSLEESERRQASLPMRGADVRRNAEPRQIQPERLTRGVGVLDPATQLRQATLPLPAGQTVPVEAMRSDRRACVLFHLQIQATRIRLPGDASGRVAGMKIAQAGEVFVATARVLRPS